MRITNLDNNAVIKWRLSDSCQFKCPYCIRKVFVKDADAVKDNDKCMEALPEIIRIAEEIESHTNKKVKVDLIGGEITILKGVKEIVSKLLGCKSISKVNITTNAELIDTLKSLQDSRVTITCSYHPSQTKYSIEEWFENVSGLRGFGYLKVETVYTKEASHIERFIELADGYKLDYQVEEDLMDKSLEGKECSSTKRNFRYEVEDDNGVVRKFMTRNSFLKQHGIDGCKIYSGNKLCSRDFDYVYVEQDKAVLCASASVPVKDYHPVREMHPCWRGLEGFCTLCGNISVETMKEFVFI